jgi:hypothetical protein
VNLWVVQLNPSWRAIATHPCNANRTTGKRDSANTVNELSLVSQQIETKLKGLEKYLSKGPVCLAESKFSLVS